MEQELLSFDLLFVLLAEDCILNHKKHTQIKILFDMPVVIIIKSLEMICCFHLKIEAL